MGAGIGVHKTRKEFGSISSYGGLLMTTLVRFAVLGFSLVALAPGFAQEKKEPIRYKSNDITRPRPRVVEPGTASTAEKPGVPPSDAIVLFGGSDLSEWIRGGKKADAPDAAPTWTVTNGYAEIKGGSISSKKRFGDAQIHIEWATPQMPKGSGQGRGNSGLYMGGFGEVQILDSFENDTYPDGQAAALYGRSPPLVNASRKPGEWQTYDIITRLAKVDDAGKIVRPAALTVLHNGVVVHHAFEFPGKPGEYSLNLQDHGNPIRFRSIWVRPLADYDVGGTPAPEKKKK